MTAHHAGSQHDAIDQYATCIPKALQYCNAFYASLGMIDSMHAYAPLDILLTSSHKGLIQQYCAHIAKMRGMCVSGLQDAEHSSALVDTLLPCICIAMLSIKASISAQP